MSMSVTNSTVPSGFYAKEKGIPKPKWAAGIPFFYYFEGIAN